MELSGAEEGKSSSAPVPPVVENQTAGRDAFQSYMSKLKTQGQALKEFRPSDMSHSVLVPPLPHLPPRQAVAATGAGTPPTMEWGAWGGQAKPYTEYMDEYATRYKVVDRPTSMLANARRPIHDDALRAVERRWSGQEASSFGNEARFASSKKAQQRGRVQENEATRKRDACSTGGEYGQGTRDGEESAASVTSASSSSSLGNGEPSGAANHSPRVTPLVDTLPSKSTNRGSSLSPSSSFEAPHRGRAASEDLQEEQREDPPPVQPLVRPSRLLCQINAPPAGLATKREEGTDPYGPIWAEMIVKPDAISLSGAAGVAPARAAREETLVDTEYHSNFKWPPEQAFHPKTYEGTTNSEREMAELTAIEYDEVAQAQDQVKEDGRPGSPADRQDVLKRWAGAHTKGPQKSEHASSFRWPPHADDERRAGMTTTKTSAELSGNLLGQASPLSQRSTAASTDSLKGLNELMSTTRRPSRCSTASEEGSGARSTGMASSVLDRTTEYDDRFVRFPSDNYRGGLHHSHGAGPEQDHVDALLHPTRTEPDEEEEPAQEQHQGDDGIATADAGARGKRPLLNMESVAREPLAQTPTPASIAAPGMREAEAESGPPEMWQTEYQDEFEWMPKGSYVTGLHHKHGGRAADDHVDQLLHTTGAKSEDGAQDEVHEGEREGGERKQGSSGSVPGSTPAHGLNETEYQDEYEWMPKGSYVAGLHHKHGGRSTEDHIDKLLHPTRAEDQPASKSEKEGDGEVGQEEEARAEAASGGGENVLTVEQAREMIREAETTARGVEETEYQDEYEWMPKGSYVAGLHHAHGGRAAEDHMDKLLHPKRNTKPIAKVEQGVLSRLWGEANACLRGIDSHTLRELWCMPRPSHAVRQILNVLCVVLGLLQSASTSWEEVRATLQANKETLLKKMRSLDRLSPGVSTASLASMRTVPALSPGSLVHVSVAGAKLASWLSALSRFVQAKAGDARPAGGSPSAAAAFSDVPEELFQRGGGRGPGGGSIASSSFLPPPPSSYDSARPRHATLKATPRRVTDGDAALQVAQEAKGDFHARAPVPPLFPSSDVDEEEASKHGSEERGEEKEGGSEGRSISGTSGGGESGRSSSGEVAASAVGDTAAASAGSSAEAQSVRSDGSKSSISTSAAGASSVQSKASPREKSRRRRTPRRMVKPVLEPKFGFVDGKWTYSPRKGATYKGVNPRSCGLPLKRYDPILANPRWPPPLGDNRRYSVYEREICHMPC